MPLRLQAVTFDAQDPARLAQFWATLLGRSVEQDGGVTRLAGDDVQVGLGFVRSDARPSRPNLMHLHLTSDGPDDQHKTVTWALSLGARPLDVGQLPAEKHVVLADPEGNELCVIPSGNAFLAGCGFLGEVACDGTREAGVFWSQALAWPLVWDQDQETAIQSQSGGTKVAWGGPPVHPTSGNRQRFELVAAAMELKSEADRLVDLGATRLETGERHGQVLTDPDGNKFHLRAE